MTQAASANYATEGYDFSGTNGAYGAANTTTTPAGNYSTNAVTTDDGRTIGFNTESDSDLATTADRHPDTPSLFHLFQNNLNMKNSAEVANYAVMPVDVALSCLNAAGSEQVEVPGMAAETIDTSLVAATEDIARTAVSGAAASIQVGGGLARLCSGRALAADGTGGINQGYMFQLEDGMVFTYDPAQAYCSESNPCFGYIDVNGPTGPNRVIACSEEGGADAWIPTYGRNADAGTLLADCTVEAKDITDIYPVVFYGSTVKPASIAAKSVLYSKKSNQTAATTSSSTSSSGGSGG